MLGTYACFALVLAGSACAGQAVFALAGLRRWSWLAPAVGFAALIAIAWATVRLPGEGTTALIALALAVAGSLAFLRGRLTDPRASVRAAVPFALGAAVLASLPFIVEARFGILGTGLNPDMSQHLFAVDRLAAGGSERLISEGYPLGPHALVAALAALGPSTVEAFDGLTLAIAVTACLAPLALLAELPASRRYAGALVVGLAYLVASSLVQGAFKETAQATFVLAFAIGLHELARRRIAPSARSRALAGLPLAVLAVGSVYVYSFPGLAWLAGALAVWAAIEVGLGWRERATGHASALISRAAPTAVAAACVVAVAIAPEAGRMGSFAGFETFDPDGPGLGNLFDRLSPLEALGIWPSGDFRVEPGDGAVPALAFYLGAGVALAALGFGIARWVRRGDRAVPAAFCAAALLWLVALVAGTPYQEAKALVFAAPLASLIAVRALLEAAPTPAEARRILERRPLAHMFPGGARIAKQRLAIGALAVAFVAASAGSSALALVNGPIGPSGYSPALAELRPRLGEGSTLVLAPRKLLEDQHGRDYLVWELRGNRICVAVAGRFEDYPRRLSRTVGVELDADGAVVPAGLMPANLMPAERSGPASCPLIPDGARADPAGDG